jgi:undecaprenyl phosphate-alpha-L-ara4N flippase subunit ArnE
VFDIAGQVCFKLGIGDEDDADGERHGVGAFLAGLMKSPWILASVAVYAIEFVVYFAALTLAPLSLAYPFNALAYCGVVLASRTILGERVSARRWAGTFLIAAGVALVCWP